ncbi:MAG: hypothetical protein L3J11_11685, partial [Draconibacterium sp.]|nr:hypothetical protein [Draconibacterium sp.]
IDEVILCDNKAKNVAIAIVTARLFNEVSVQKNELKRSGYFITSPLFYDCFIFLWGLFLKLKYLLN